MPPNAEAVAETRSRIHEAATALFTKQGFNGTGMREIADTAGVSVGNLYNHHPNKEALFAAIMESYEEAYTGPETPLARAFASFESFEDLERIGEASREMVRQYAAYIRLIYVDVVELGGEHIRRLFGGMRSRYEEQFGERFRKLKDEGRIGEVDPIDALMTATISYFYLFNVEHVFGVEALYQVPDDAAIKTIAHLFRTGVKPR